MGKIFNIQHFSVHDGPGIRTVIFFKGCNLSCLWCHNPESQSNKNSIMLYPEKCLGCQFCVKNCPNQCHSFDKSNTHVISYESCENCQLCTKNCYAEALVSVGEDVLVPFVINAILSNEAYFKNSNGGVTFSGGECMLQIDFLKELLIACKDNNIHTAVDTAGDVTWDYFNRILPHVDLFLYDLKAFDADVHAKLTGKSNDRILKNFSLLYESGANIIVRIPFIKNMNDGEMELIATFLKQYKDVKVEILPYHTLGASKYQALGAKQNLCEEAMIATKDEVEQVKKLFSIGGIDK